MSVDFERELKAMIKKSDMSIHQRRKLINSYEVIGYLENLIRIK